MNWWSNELDSLGIKKESTNSSSNNNNKDNNKSEFPSQQLEDLTDGIKQRFIRDYKACYDG